MNTVDLEPVALLSVVRHLVGTGEPYAQDHRNTRADAPLDVLDHAGVDCPSDVRDGASPPFAAREKVRVMRHMLRDPARSIKETAAALGFVNARTFHRAFKRWTGMTPMEYRHTREGG
jgi:AraC-like DNA-binding protein